jgi:transcriptional regulator with XRE-family HTH domain
MGTQSAPEQAQPTLKDLRLKRGLSVRELGRRTGIDPTHLSRVERGRAHLSVDALARVAQALGMRGLTRQLAPFREAE